MLWQIELEFFVPQLFFQAILIFDKNYLSGSQLGAPP